MIAICSLLLLLVATLSNGKVVINRKVQAELEKGSDGIIMVSFEAAIVKDAYSPAAVLSALKRWNRIRSDTTMSKFVGSGDYADLRGEFVYTLVSRVHEETKARLLKLLPPTAITQSIPISNLFLIRNLPGVFDKVKNMDGVVEISVNEPFQVPSDYKTVAGHKTASEIQWNIRKINAPQVWSKGRAGVSRGEGIVIGVADTGVLYTHPVLRGNYRGISANGSYEHNYNWWDGVREHVPFAPESDCPVAGNVPCDDEGHGTHCTSTAAGDEGYGVAPGAKWIGCRNMEVGTGSTATYLSCLNFFMAPHDLKGKNAKPSLRPHVVGNSYGCPDNEGCSIHAMTAAVNILRASGIFMSVSAGNEGPGCSTLTAPPSFEPQVISVGATNINDLLTFFSSRGPVFLGKKKLMKPEVVAPGNLVTAAVLNNGFATYSGTSMASPHVTGAAALIMANCPCLMRDIGKIQGFLQKTALKLYPTESLLMGNKTYCGGDTTTTYPNNYYGYGRIDVAEAVKACIKYCYE